jgi:predicted RNase H-like nuclease (RuvC/YqgF family)
MEENMSDTHDGDKDGTPSFTHPEMVNVLRRDWESSQFMIKKLLTRNERLKAEVDRVTTEHTRLKEAANKLRKQLYELQALAQGGREAVN